MVSVAKSRKIWTTVLKNTYDILIKRHLLSRTEDKIYPVSTFEEYCNQNIDYFKANLHAEIEWAAQTYKVCVYNLTDIGTVFSVFIQQ